MMATSVGLNFRLTAAVENFERSMSEVNKKLGQIETSSKQTATGMKLLAGIEVGKLLVGGLTKIASMATSAASSIVSFANSARDTADKIGKLSSQTGMAVEPLQVLQQIAEYSGLSLDSFRSAAQKMSRSLGDAANGMGMAGKSLERMGLDLNKLLRMSPSRQFMVIGEAIASIEDPAIRSAEAAAIFGRNGMTMIPMFKDLTKVASETGKEMLSLGQVLSTDQVRNIEAMNDSFVTVQQTAKKIGTQVLANFAPALTAANNALLEMIKNFEYEGATGGQGVARLLTDGLFAGAKAVAETLDMFLGGFDKTVDMLIAALARLITAFEVVSAPFIGADAAARLGVLAQNLEGAVRQSKSVDVSFASLVDKAKALYDSAGTAADGLAKASVSFGDASQPASSLAQSFSKAAAAAGATWQPLGTLGNKGSVAALMMHDLAIKTATAAGSADLTADEVARLGKAAKFAADEMPEPPKAMELSQEKYVELFAANQEQADILLGMLEEGSKKSFKQSVVDSYMNKWQQQADALMQMYIANGTASEKQLKDRMALEKQMYQGQLKKMSQHSVWAMRMEEQVRREALKNYTQSDALSGDNGIFSQDDPYALPLNEDPGGAFDGIETELSGQTALLDAIRANTENQPIPVVLPA